MPATESKGLLIKNENDEYKSEIVSNQQKSSEIVSTEQMAVFSSNVSFSSATMSTATTASSQSASIMQSTQSGITQETKRSVESFTKHASSQNQSISLFETQISPNDFVQLSLNNPMENFINTTASTKEESSTTEAFTKTHSKEAMTIKEGKQLTDMGSDMLGDNKKITLDSSAKTKISEHYPKKQFVTNEGIKTFPEEKSPILNTTSGFDQLSYIESSNVTFQPKVLKNLEPKPVSQPLSLKKSVNVPDKKTAPSRPISEKTSHKPSDFKKDNSSITQNAPLKRGSLLDALTIAPERPYSPLRFLDVPTYYTASSEQNILSDIQSKISSSIPFESTAAIETDQYLVSEDNKEIRSTFEQSAFKPVTRQVFPPPKPEEFQALSNYSTAYKNNQSNFEQINEGKYEVMTMTQTEIESCAVTTSSSSLKNSSSVKTAQNYFEQQNQNRSLSSTYTKPSSSSQTTEITEFKNSGGEMSQTNITPESQKDSVFAMNESKTKTCAQVSQNQPLPKESTAMTFQPVREVRENSPLRSRPTTPSLINKPAPIIPHYQMNLVTVEYSAPKSQVYEPSSTEVSRSSTPMPRSKSPGQASQGGNLKAHAPRVKDHATPKQIVQMPTNLNIESEKMNKNYNLSVNSPFTTPFSEQPSFVTKSRDSNAGYQIENYKNEGLSYKENSMFNQNYAQKQMQAHNITEYGNTTMETTKKTYEEFEQMQTSKVIEIKRGGSQTCDSYPQIETNNRPSNISKQVFPPPKMSLPATYENLSPNNTNEIVVTTNRQSEIYKPIPSISGANQGPVCDPTPSTGSSVGGAARGKTFGVSSAPKRGRGVLNKAVMPGSRVPLCASCNGNIR